MPVRVQWHAPPRDAQGGASLSFISHGGDILSDIATARPICRGRERIWLDELHTYLTEVIRMRSVTDSLVYSVVLDEERPGGDRTPTFREFVTVEECYFHPYGVRG